MIQVDVHKTLNAPEGDMSLALSFSVDRGQLITLYGPSGAGKTSTLRLLAGLMTPDSGSIIVDGRPWVDLKKGINLRPQQRGIGFVFQDYALFPHMTVRQNLLFALNKGQSEKIVEELIEITALGALQFRKPASLSGGQQQRVALARAIVQHPSVLLLDEPLSALDYDMRQKLQAYLVDVHQEFGLTTILISHDISEISRLSDLVVEIQQGKIIAKAPPSAFFDNKSFVGHLECTGEVLFISAAGQGVELTIKTGNDFVKIIVDHIEARGIQVGDRVQVMAKAILPGIRKLP